MNKASQSLALAEPALLNDRRKLIELTRIKVDEDGYVYKHGKSRSKRLHSSSDAATSGFGVKRSRTSEAERLQRIAYIDEALSDIKKQIGFKEKRGEQLTNAHNYGACEKISGEISALKRKQFELRNEIGKLKRRQQQCEWYKQRKKQEKISVSHTSFDQSDNDSNDLSTPSIVSSRCSTPVSPVLLVPSQSSTQLSSSSELQLPCAEVEIVAEELSTSNDIPRNDLDTSSSPDENVCTSDTNSNL